MNFISSATFWYVVFAVIIVIFAVLVIRSYVKKLSQGCCGASSGAKLQKVKVKDKNKRNYPYKAELAVDAMVCENCCTRIENALNSLDGIWASADLSSGKVTVLAKNPIDDSLLRNTVNNIGAYTVMQVSKS